MHGTPDGRCEEKERGESLAAPASLGSGRDRLVGAGAGDCAAAVAGREFTGAVVQVGVTDGDDADVVVRVAGAEGDSG